MDKPTIRVAAAIIRDEGKFIIVKRDERGRLPGQWEFPGTAVAENAALEEALKEALASKFNLDVVIGDKVATVSHKYDFGIVEVNAFYVECISKKLKLAEHQAYRWVRTNSFREFDLVSTVMPVLEVIRQAKS